MRNRERKILSLEPKWYALEIGIASIVGLLASLLLVLLSSLMIKFFSIPTDIIPLINCIIKIISVFVGCVFCLKRPKNGWMRGALVGIIFTPLAFVVFSLLGGEFTFGISLLNDLAISMVVGVVSGILAVNIRN